MCGGNLRLKNDLDISLNISGYGQPGSRCYVEVCVVQDELTPYRIRSDQCVIPRGENIIVVEYIVQYTVYLEYVSNSRNYIDLHW